MNRRAIEMTYSVPPSAVRIIYEIFNASSAACPERFFTTQAKRPRTVLHFYLTATNGADVRRIRVRRHRGNQLISLDSKQVLREDDLLIEKDETIENSRLPLAEVADLLCSEAAIASSFIKNQHRLVLSEGSRTLKVSLDQMLPFHAEQQIVLGSQFWHLEFEEVNDWPLIDFRGSSFFQTYLSVLKPLLESKWQSAALWPPTGIDWISRETLPGYLDRLITIGKAVSYLSPLHDNST